MVPWSIFLKHSGLGSWTVKSIAEGGYAVTDVHYNEIESGEKMQ